MKENREQYQKYREIIRYLITGVLTTAVSLLVYYACVLTVLDPKLPVQLQTANVISWVCAVSFAYAANRRFVFQSRSEHRLAEALRFFGARILTLVIDMAMMAVLVSLLGADDKISKPAVQIVVIVLNYVLSKWLVFRQTE